MERDVSPQVLVTMNKIFPFHWDRVFLVFISFCWASGELEAVSSCSEEWVCVETVDQNSYVEVFARNKKNHPVTLSLWLKASNLTPSDLAITQVLAGGENAKLHTLRRTNKHHTYHYEFRFDWAIGDANAQPLDYVYALPFRSGETYRVLQGFASSFSHQGLEKFAVDFDMPVGSEVYAAREGVVTDVVTKYDRGCWEPGCGKYANFIVISHSDGTTGEYYHLRESGSVVKFGDRVHRGQLIGYSGNTGHTTMPHLHFAVYRPTTWGKTQSLPFKFEAARGIITNPRSGERYTAK